ncbi:MAG: ribonucleoside-diphosphate reductase subunit alpha [Candidatus Margulisbacteria bacterium]|nr:ribonucleoside-diphosphate reductase subunit alpha [Candidatus Margulisiibacteriota bacterium]
MKKTIDKIVKRNGMVVSFDRKLIFSALEKAFYSENITDLVLVANLVDQVVNEVSARLDDEAYLSVEVVQDIVEEMLMKNGHYKVAKAYIIYRETHKKVREERTIEEIKDGKLTLSNETTSEVFDPVYIEKRLHLLSFNLDQLSIDGICASVLKQVYKGIRKEDLNKIVLNSIRELIEQHPNYALLSSRYALDLLSKKIIDAHITDSDYQKKYQEGFIDYIQKGVKLEMLNPEFLTFDLQKLSQGIQAKNDLKFKYLGIQIVQDRYLLRDRSTSRDVYELPQWFWLRVAMGLSLKETNREERALEFYTILSQMDFVSSTPTLFNSGTLHSQMSSCYINITDDSLKGIFKLFSDNAMLSKWAGGIGTDWTPVRATGSRIHGTNGESQGVIPFIKIFNDTALAVNQGGKRKGAMCAYMETWHLDFEQFLELKKNTGDERRRAHDINTACWIPDLFMQRLREKKDWTFFCPSDVPDLHDLYGKDFQKRYEYYESLNLPRAKTINSFDLWRKMLTMLFETGHPWFTFKDPINLRSPQDHVGVVHSSNLCTEITLNTSSNETAVCNLGSINLGQMVENGQLNEEKIAKTVRSGIRMLDNVIDNNYYPTEESKYANLKHRAVGLGMMGYQDALYQLNISFDSEENLDFADRSMEMVSYYAILASSELAKERGVYETFKGSKWDRGILPYDTLAILEEHRGEALDVDKQTTMDWTTVRNHIAQHGMRNSNTMAIAPTATIANIAGVYPCAEPAFKNIYMKENLSGNFIVINVYLVEALSNEGLWTPQMLKQIKLHNGSIQEIPEIPSEIRSLFKETFDIDMAWIIKAAARRGKWIDQSASTNIFVNSTSGKYLNDIYTLAWNSGLKTTYYLRSLGATQVLKTTGQAETAINEPETQEKPTLSAESISVAKKENNDQQPELMMCKLNDPTCEACE